MNVLQLFRPITAFAFDIDGVLTDGQVLLTENGEQLRKMNIRDGYALQLAVKKGYPVLAVSGAVSAASRTRLNKLGVQQVLLGVENKLEAIAGFLAANHLGWETLLYMGDDIPDYDAMCKAGLSCAPADAAPEIRQVARYISTFKGGEGCVRDVIEKTLKLKGDWELHTGIASR